jgi:ABC-type multidrug transport system ATPase subunit
MMDGDVGKLSGGWKMRVALARILLMRPDVMLLDEPSNHLDLESLIWLEEFLKGYEGALLMTSHDREFMNRIVNKIIEIDGGSLTSYSGDYEFYEQQRAMNEKQQQAQFERQQAMLAKEIKFIERFKARASHAAQVQSRVKKLDKIDRVEPPKRRQSCLRLPAGAALRRRRRHLKNVHKRYGSRTIYEGLDFMVRRKERWCIMGINGAGKSTLLKLVTGSTRSGHGNGGASAPASRWAISRSTPWICWMASAPCSRRWKIRSRRPARAAARAGRLLRLFRRRCREALPRAVGRREGAAGHGQDAVRPAQPAGARRADQPPGHRHQGNADQGAVAVRGHHAVRLARPAFPGGAVEPRAGADAGGHPPIWRRLHGICRAHRPGSAGA